MDAHAIYVGGKRIYMCIAIYKGYENFIDEKTLRNCFTVNPDGAGFALFSSREGFVYRKGLMTFTDFMDAYRPYNGENKDHLTKGLIHFRIATHGEVNADNTHPFVIERASEPSYKVALIHNGIIADMAKVRDKSDTLQFVESILQPTVDAGKYGWMTDGFRVLSEKYIGWSKIAIMDSEGHRIILNERSGHWVEGVWFSNYTFEGYSNYLYGGWEQWAGAEYEGYGALASDLVGTSGTNTEYTRSSDGDYIRRTEDRRYLSSVSTDNASDRNTDYIRVQKAIATKPASELKETPTLGSVTKAPISDGQPMGD